MKLALGTAQFGLDYGISNRQGQTSFAEVSNILRVARDLSIDLLDTAPLYGRAEQILGELGIEDFGVVTKTPHFSSRSLLDENDAATLYRTAEASIDKLGATQLHGLLVHRIDDLLLPGADLLFEALLRLKSEGLARKIGVSAYRRESLDLVLSRYPFDLVQVPANLLDQRLTRDGYLASISAKGIEVHVRSVFLQGLLLMRPADLPPHLKRAASWLQSFHCACEAVSLTAVEAALAFIESVPGVDYAVVGAVDASQLDQIGLAANRVDSQSNGIDWSRLSCDDGTILDPSQWRPN